MIPLLHLIPEPINAMVIDRVLEARMLSIGAVTEVALDKHHLLADIDGLCNGCQNQTIKERKNNSENSPKTKLSTQLSIYPG